MKKLFTLFCLVATVCAVNAQNNYKSLDGGSLSNLKLAPSIQKKNFTNTDRAASYALMLDYDGVDETYASNAGYDYARFVWDLNRRFPNSSGFTLKYAAVMFDTLQFVDPNSGNLSFYPKSKSTLTMDSFDVFFIHKNNTGNPDSITFTVFNTASKSVSGYGTPGAVLTTPKLWDTTIVTNSTIPLNTTNFTIATFYPGVSLPQGQAFGIRVDFAGDTANDFQVIAGYRDECADACFAEITTAGNNSGYYLNLTQQTSNLSGYFENFGQGAIYYDCNQSGNFTAGACENFPIQNFIFIPYLTADVAYGATIVSDSLRGCPNAQLNLKANAFGSTATPFTYSWATTSGSLTSSTDEEVSLIIGNSNATVTVTVTDANNQTTVASVVVQSRGVTVSITNNNPLVINCGASATLLTTIGGFTTGKNYVWSTGASGANTATIQVNQPGNYKVTVTNSSGCSASASIDVQYPGGLANNISFTLPSPPVCQGKPVTFTNTSTRRNGWNFQWTFGDQNVGFTENGTNTYANPGVYQVKLTQDSAGCSFSSATQNITVLPASNSACVVGIEDVAFSNTVSLLPNPTNGNVTISVAGIEKNLSIRVYNIIGSEVINYNTSDVASTFNKTFDFSALTNGTYLVKIQSGDKVAVKRLTVAK
ncbi:MAG: T9SS type A sorting domain-containing protein [Chitinophagales bacterium]|nr:T9SS type A sorting domain-containing protein [Chitinophagales bacterium]